MTIRILVASALLAGTSIPAFASAEEPQAGSPENGALTVVHKPGEDFLVPASPAVAEDILGKGFTRDLRDIDSNGKKIIAVYKGKLTTMQPNAFATRWSEISDEMQFDLSAGYFGLGVGARTSDSSRVALLTVYQIDKIVKIDSSGEIPATEAELTPTEIWYGWCLNYLFQGQSNEGELSASLKLMSAGVDFKAQLAKRKITSTFQATGLDRKDQSEIPIVLSLSDVLKYFSPAKKPQPIFVKYQAVRPISSSLLAGARPKAQPQAKCEGDACITDAWVSAATDTVKGLLSDKGEELAKTIQQIAHPTAKNPRIGTTRVERSAKGIAVVVESDWTGGFLGGSHSTTVTWEIGPGKSAGIRVSDNANVAIAASNMEQLRRYFEETLYGEIADGVSPK